MVGTYGTIIVFNPDPWWDSSVMIPTAGMIIGSAVSGPSLAVERLLSEICEKRHETETRLCFGANRLEAVLPIMRSALLAALTPNLNQMAVVGLVSIPGMMTG
jgi:putative ABC transport system permease protein